jgi:RNase H-like domain found in reverse transcriptase
MQDLGKISRPFYEVREQEILEWTPDMETVFNKIHTMATDLPFRVLWNPIKHLHIRTDASEDGMGIVLEQNKVKEWYPLAFYSRTWRANEKN